MSTEPVNSFEASTPASSAILAKVLIASFALHILVFTTIKLPSFKAKPAAQRQSIPVQISTNQTVNEPIDTPSSPTNSAGKIIEPAQVINKVIEPNVIEQPIISTNTQSSFNTSTNDQTETPAQESTPKPIKNAIPRLAPDNNESTTSPSVKTETEIEPQLDPKPTHHDQSEAAKELRSATASKAEMFISGTDQAPVPDALESTVTQEIGIFSAPKFAGKTPTVITPKEAQRKRLTGMVVLRGRVSTNSEIIDLVIYKSSGYQILDEAALNQAKQWKFEAAKVNGEYQSQAVEFPVVFR